MACTTCERRMRGTSSGGGERVAVRVRARCACSGPADIQPMASDTSTPSLLLTCKRVLQCGSTWVAGEANTRAACVTSVLCTRVIVCRAQRGERGRGGGEAEARAMPVRDMPLGGTGLQLFCNFFSAPCRTRSEHTRKLCFCLLWATGFETHASSS